MFAVCLSMSVFYILAVTDVVLHLYSVLAPGALKPRYLFSHWLPLRYKPHFKGFELHIVKMNSPSTCTCQRSTVSPLHDEVCAHKGNSVPVYRRGAAQRQVRVVAVVIWVSYFLAVWSIVAPTGLLLFNCIAYCHSRVYSSAKLLCRSKRKREKSCQSSSSSSSEISVDLCRRVVFLLKKGVTWKSEDKKEKMLKPVISKSLQLCCGSNIPV